MSDAGLELVVARRRDLVFVMLELLYLIPQNMGVPVLKVSGEEADGLLLPLVRKGNPFQVHPVRLQLLDDGRADAGSVNTYPHVLGPTVFQLTDRRLDFLALIGPAQRVEAVVEHRHPVPSAAGGEDREVLFLSEVDAQEHGLPVRLGNPRQDRVGVFQVEDRRCRRDELGHDLLPEEHLGHGLPGVLDFLLDVRDCGVVERGVVPVGPVAVADVVRQPTVTEIPEPVLASRRGDEQGAALAVHERRADELMPCLLVRYQPGLVEDDIVDGLACHSVRVGGRVELDTASVLEDQFEVGAAGGRRRLGEQPGRYLRDDSGVASLDILVLGSDPPTDLPPGRVEHLVDQHLGGDLGLAETPTGRDALEAGLGVKHRDLPRVRQEDMVLELVDGIRRHFGVGQPAFLGDKQGHLEAQFAVRVVFLAYRIVVAGLFERGLHRRRNVDLRLALDNLLGGRGNRGVGVFHIEVVEGLGQLRVLTRGTVQPGHDLVGFLAGLMDHLGRVLPPDLQKRFGWHVPQAFGVAQSGVDLGVDFASDAQRPLAHDLSDLTLDAIVLQVLTQRGVIRVADREIL